MSYPANVYVRRARWLFAAAIVLVAAFLIVNARSATSGFGHRGAHYLIMYVWSVGSIVVPTLIGIDFVGHAVWSIVEAVRGNVRFAAKIVLFTVAADTLLGALTLAAAVAVLQLSG